MMRRVLIGASMRLEGVKDDLFQVAWREYREGASLRGASSDSFEIDVPRWFVVCELGEGVCRCAQCASDGGASLSKTFERWRRVNRSTLDYLDRIRAMQAYVRRSETLGDVIARVRAHLEETQDG